jgi:SAM-dependent methyltransferase
LSLNDFRVDSYSLITAIEVIEHLQHPRDDLSRIHSLLKDGGLFYITTPNSNGLLARMKKSKWREAKKLFHINLFNWPSLKALLNDAGFRDVKYIRFSPLTTNSFKSVVLHRSLQFFFWSIRRFKSSLQKVINAILVSAVGKRKQKRG